MIRRHPGVVETPVGTRVVLYHRDNRTASVLNPTGAMLWQRLGEDVDTIEALVDALAADHSHVDRESVARDVGVFVDDLTQKGLISADG